MKLGECVLCGCCWCCGLAPSVLAHALHIDAAFPALFLTHRLHGIISPLNGF
jgi:hypothetical protein